MRQTACPEHTPATTTVSASSRRCPVPHSSGVIINQDWFALTSMKLAIITLGGMGTVHVALFEGGSAPPKEALEYGRQLSNWLPLPLDRGPSKQGPTIR